VQYLLSAVVPMSSISHPRPLDIAGLAFLALCWGSSFMFVKTALAGFTPIGIAVTRICLAAMLLVVVARLYGHTLPRHARDWGLLAAAGIVGSAIPFSLISWGQQFIPSAMAAILMSFTPLATIALAHVMTGDERLSAVKVLGVLVGIAGVFLLVGAPTVETGPMSVAGKLAILAAAFGYALSSLLLRKASHLPTLVSAGGHMVSAALTVSLFALLLGQPLTRDPGAREILSVVILGVFPSALAAIVLVMLLRRVGATFVALNNYLVPVVGTLLGVLLLGEPAGAGLFAGMMLILAGVLITQQAQRRQLRQRHTRKNGQE